MPIDLWNKRMANSAGVLKIAASAAVLKNTILLGQVIPSTLTKAVKVQVGFDHKRKEILCKRSIFRFHISSSTRSCAPTSRRPRTSWLRTAWRAARRGTWWWLPSWSSRSRGRSLTASQRGYCYFIWISSTWPHLSSRFSDSVMWRTLSVEKWWLEHNIGNIYLQCLSMKWHQKHFN